MSLKDKRALVTGGSRGIGRAICSMLLREGARVVFTYHCAQEAARALQEEAAGRGAVCLPLRADVRDFEGSRGAVEEAKRLLGGLDILVNNAGITADKALMMMSRQDWEAVVETNLGGVFNMTRNAIVAFLKQKGGSIVNITSVSGMVGLPRQTNYAAAKAGIIGFTKALAREVAAYGIRVNAVAPGFIETDMVAGLAPQLRERMLARIPAGRFGSADDVAYAVRFLLGEEAAFITGQVLVSDGGLSLAL